MNTVTKKEIAEIKEIAAEHFEGDLRKGIAAHVHGLGVVKMVGLPKFGDAESRRRRGDILRQINAADKPKAPAAPKKPKKGKSSEAVNV